MLSALSSDKMAWHIYIYFSNLCNEERRLLKKNGIILISLSPKCPNVPTHANRFPYYQSIALILCTLQAPVNNKIAVWFADCRTHYAIPLIISFLADYPEQCTISRVNSSWCAGCEICPDNIPGSTHRSRDHHLQWYLHLSTTATSEVGR